MSDDNSEMKADQAYLSVAPDGTLELCVPNSVDEGNDDEEVPDHIGLIIKLAAFIDDQDNMDLVNAYWEALNNAH